MNRLIEKIVRAGVGDGLALGRLADQRLALVGEGDHAGRQPIAFLVGNDLRFLPFHDGHDRVGRSQVDADDLFALSHASSSFLTCRQSRMNHPPA